MYAVDVFQITVLRPYPRIIKACGDGMGRKDLAVVVGKKKTLVALNNPFSAPGTGHPGSMGPGFKTQPGRLHPDKSGFGGLDKRGEKTDGVGPAPHTGYQGFHIQIPFGHLECRLR